MLACLGQASILDWSGTLSDISGDSIQCRIYHLEAAAADPVNGPTTHCSHGHITSLMADGTTDGPCTGLVPGQ